MNFPDIIGLMGVGLILSAYLALQINKISAQDWRYSALNALGAAGILYSLAYSFNFASFIIEIAWLLISLYGLVKALQKRRAA